MSGDDNKNNPFKRLKHQVEGQVATTLQGLVGLPSVISFSIDTRKEPKEKDAAAGDQHPPTLPLPAQSRTSPSSTMDSLLDLGQLIEAITFSAYSPYSPTNLQSLHPSIPTDLPHADPDVFTFADAFEDLLLVSSGRPPLDVSTRYRWRKSSRAFQPTGESPLTWLGRLHEQGLLSAYFPRRDALLVPQFGLWEHLVDEFHKLAATAESDLGKRETTTSPPAPRKSDATDPFQELRDMATGAFKQITTTTTHPSDHKPVSIEDVFHKGISFDESDLDKFFKDFRDGILPPTSSNRSFSSSTTTTSATEQQDQPSSRRTVSWTSRTVNSDGEVQNSRVRRVLDQDGNIVEENRQHWVGDAEEPPSNDENESSGNNGEGGDPFGDRRRERLSREENHKQKGWFWK